MPLVRRIPKRGFNNRWARTIATVNVSDLEESFSAGEQVDPAALQAHNLAKGRHDEIKILGDGQLTKKLKVAAHRFSKSAREKIEQAGGEIVVLDRKPSAGRREKLSDA